MDKSTVLKMINADILGFNNEKSKISETLENYRTEFKGYMNDLLSQMIAGGSAPLLARTPKVAKKKGKRIKAILEDDEIENDNNLSNTRLTRSSRIGARLQMSDIYQSKSKRAASTKPSNVINKQLSNDETDLPLENTITGNQSKRPKELLQSSEDEERRPSKLRKVTKKKTLNKNKTRDESHDVIDDSIQETEGNETISSEKQQKKTTVKRKLEQNDKDTNITLTSEQMQKSLPTDEPVAKKANYSKIISPKNEKYVETVNKISEQSLLNEREVLSKRATRSSASVINAQGSSQYTKANIINETIDMSNGDEMVASMYEDAIGKPVPIMNSTMNPNMTVTLEKMMNATVVIEPLAIKNKFNETVTITKKKSSFKEPLSNETVTITKKRSSFKEPLSNETVTITKKRSSFKEPLSNETVTITKKKSSFNESLSNSTIKESEAYNANITRTIVHKSPKNINNTTVNYGKINAKTKKDINLEKFNELLTDDESSPERKGYGLQKQQLSNKKNRITRSNTSIMSEEEVFETPIKRLRKNKDLKANTLKNNYKPTAFFSPYAKESVKKRVEAFEQVASPKISENEIKGRVTRTKTRALATVNSEAPPETVVQILARKSLAKAKKISLAKQTKEDYETKELGSAIKTKHKKATNSLEKSAQKSQLKTTPLGKRTLQIPSSISKNQYATPSNTQNLNAHSKPMSASRGNIVTHVDSFIQPMKSAQKTIDRAAEEKRRRAHEEDARRKREELLKAQAEEKKRKREEKELKNKLAREAKEKLDQEKRLKTEKEKEEKAKLAQQMQEKHKEEMEKKRIAQLQRAQIKEERRKQEEQLRLQRLQEQKEQEKVLAEQRRCEQEQEKRKLLAEAKLRNQALMQQAKVKVVAQKLAPTNYKIDSDPDEDESDDERKPKHPIPSWASRHIRQTQLAMQQHIPMKMVTKFFDAQKCTPDLRELFIGIDQKKLKRSSSAIWKTPPRYSMMNSILED